MRHESMIQSIDGALNLSRVGRSLAFAYSLIVAWAHWLRPLAHGMVSDSRASPISDREIHALDRVKANVARPFNTSGHKYN